MLSAKSQYATVSHDEFIISSKEAETPVERPTDHSTEFYDEWMNVNAKVNTTEVVTEEEICSEIQSKRRKESTAVDPDEKPLSTRQMLEAF